MIETLNNETGDVQNKQKAATITLKSKDKSQMLDLPTDNGTELSSKCGGLQGM